MKQALNTLLCAPHRLGFLFGGIVCLGSFLLWMLEILTRHHAPLLHGPIPAMFWHGYVMIYGFFPLFMLGFIYTAGPRWLNINSPKLVHYLPVIAGFALGSLAILLGRISSAAMLLGLTLATVSWILATAIWCRGIWASTVNDKQHAIFIAGAFSLGGIGMLLGTIWLGTGQTWAWQAAIELGLWGFLLPVFLAVSHRMIPFFSANVLPAYSAWRPYWLLYTWGGLLAAGLICRLFQINTLIIHLALAGLFLYTSFHWQWRKAYQVKLLAMLHMAFLWTGISLTLFALNDALVLQGQSGLGFAPLHALTLGFFCTMLLAFVTRVTLGHSGRPLQAGAVAWLAYWSLHGVALARVGGEIWPQAQNTLYLLAAILAFASLAVWSRVYLPMYWQTRIDGKAG